MCCQVLVYYKTLPPGLQYAWLASAVVIVCALLYIGKEVLEILAGWTSSIFATLVGAFRGHSKPKVRDR